jgi:putative ABC transport system ATP-binding protein
MPAAIALHNVGKVYGPERSQVAALQGVDLEVAAGTWLALMGPSGSGKTTLVNLIGCLDQPSRGTVAIDGTDVTSFSRRQLTRFRAEKIGFIFQQFHLVGYLTALENVMLAQHFHSLADESEARASLEHVGLGDRCDHLPAQLSGGEQQRVCIARALINDPKIILADEPTGNLDEANERIVMGLLADAHRAGRTIVMVTHDPAVACLATRRIQLRHGRIEDSNVGKPLAIGVVPQQR